jgi:hypothetical protein
VSGSFDETEDLDDDDLDPLPDEEYDEAEDAVSTADLPLEEPDAPEEQPPEIPDHFQGPGGVDLRKVYPKSPR